MHKADRSDTIITLDDASCRLAGIRVLAEQGKGPEAHAIEDMLFLDILIAVANGHPDSVALAKIGIQSADTEFDRWFE